MSQFIYSNSSRFNYLKQCRFAGETSITFGMSRGVPSVYPVALSPWFGS